ncbi:MAG: hypothetical protein A3K10_14735 [Bacteroidetes bacterium RIFCSPLOWO2_12_FULL_31_6]|nr:MAG: hypothetical protein A3K10_14735 [Bacteroidetes bacterium RIFCSPLOWO2_12_FULL_31_6]
MINTSLSPSLKCQRFSLALTGEFFQVDNYNKPAGSPFKITNTTTGELNSTVDVKGTIGKIDVGIKSIKSTDKNGQQSTKQEVNAGKGGNGLFVLKNNNSESTNTSVGIKFSKTVSNSTGNSISLGLKFGFDVQNDKK